MVNMDEHTDEHTDDDERESISSQNEDESEDSSDDDDDRESISSQNEDESEEKEGEEEEKNESVVNKKKPKFSKQRGTVMTEAELAKTGIIYLSRIPTLMNKDILRRYFENLGEVGRIWLELDTKAPQRGKRLIFAEGWIEFKDKRMAKRVAQCLNNTQVGGKKRYAWSEEIWNIKYLNRFKWVHLHERLSYEKAVHQQRMRTEINQAKRETNFYIENAEKNEHFKKKERWMKKQKVKDGESVDNKETGEEEQEERIYTIRQKNTEEEIVGKKRKNSGKFALKNKKLKKAKKEKIETPSQPKSFLTKIFGAGAKA